MALAQGQGAPLGPAPLGPAQYHIQTDQGKQFFLKMYIFSPSNCNNLIFNTLGYSTIFPF